MAIANAKPGDLDLRPFIKMVGLERVVEAVGPEVIESMGAKKTIDTLGEDQVIETMGVQHLLTKLTAKLTAEERKQLKESLE